MHIAKEAIAFFLLLAFLVLVPPINAKLTGQRKTIVVTNNHTNYLSVRCFSFDNEFDVVHLRPWGQYRFNITKRIFYPSATMFNCSTNMGTFVAFKYDYECSKDKYPSCDWKFDEDGVYRWEPKVKEWFAYDYTPNYESLRRGGVIKGYYAN